MCVEEVCVLARRGGGEETCGSDGVAGRYVIQEFIQPTISSLT